MNLAEINSWEGGIWLNNPAATGVIAWEKKET